MAKLGWNLLTVWIVKLCCFIGGHQTHWKHNLCVDFEVRHPRCGSQNYKFKQQTLESQNTTVLYIYIYIYIYI